MDEYGKVLDIDSELIKQYTEEQKQYARERLKNNMEDAKKELEQLKEQWDNILLHVKEEHDIMDVSFNTWLLPLKIFA